MNIPKALSDVLAASPDAKPAQQSATLQGLAVTAATLVAPSVAQLAGIDPDQLALTLNNLIQSVALLYSAWGVLRRADIRLPWVRQ